MMTQRRVPEGPSDQPSLFNTPFEAGVRAVILLDSVSPSALSLERLVALDHLVVHTEDVSGPPSLHPAVKTRAAEMLVRRGLVERGLQMMMGRGLIARLALPEGIQYAAGEESAFFVHLLKTPYSRALMERAAWLKQIALLPDNEFLEVINHQMEVWALQFQPHSEPGVD